MSPRLEYCEGDEWRPLPDWATFLWDLGAFVARWTSAHERVVCVVSLPTRVCAAALAATGYIATRSAIELISHSDQLPDGASVLYQSGDFWYRGRIEGRKEDPRTGRSLVIRIARGRGDQILVGLNNLKRVVRTDEEFSPDAHEKPFRRRRPSELNGFFESVMEGDPKGYLRSWRPRCLMLGRVGRLEDECSESRLRAILPDGSHTPEGTFADILRLPPARAAGESWHTQIATGRGAVADDEGSEEPPDLVVMDGLGALIGGRSRFRQSDAIVVLDRASSRFDDAYCIVHDEFSERTNVAAMYIRAEPPVGVQYTIFQTRRG